jgi:hypothetical protein
VPVLGYVLDLYGYGFVMEFMNESVRGAFANHKKWKVSRVVFLEYFLPWGDSCLSAVRKLKVAHGDVHMGNILLPIPDYLTVRPYFFLSDFGSATLEEASGRLNAYTPTGQIGTKPFSPYMFYELSGQEHTMPFRYGADAFMLLMCFLVLMVGKLPKSPEIYVEAKKLGMFFRTEVRRGVGWIEFIRTHEERVCGNHLHDALCMPMREWKIDYEGLREHDESLTQIFVHGLF